MGLIFIVLFFVIVAYILSKRKDCKRMKEEKQNEYFDKLLELQNLKEKHLITETEFENEKYKIHIEYTARKNLDKLSNTQKEQFYKMSSKIVHNLKTNGKKVFNVIMNIFKILAFLIIIAIIFLIIYIIIVIKNQI